VKVLLGQCTYSIKLRPHGKTISSSTIRNIHIIFCLNYATRGAQRQLSVRVTYPNSLQKRWKEMGTLELTQPLPPFHQVHTQKYFINKICWIFNKISIVSFEFSYLNCKIESVLVLITIFNPNKVYKFLNINRILSSE